MDLTSAASDDFEPRQSATGQRPSVKIYFGCCRVYSQLKPPAHVMAGKSNTWRVHCPRCGGLIEVTVQ